MRKDMGVVRIFKGAGRLIGGPESEKKDDRPAKSRGMGLFRSARVRGSAKSTSGSEKTPTSRSERSGIQESTEHRDYPVEANLVGTVPQQLPLGRRSKGDAASHSQATLSSFESSGKSGILMRNKLGVLSKDSIASSAMESTEVVLPEQLPLGRTSKKKQSSMSHHDCRELEERTEVNMSQRHEIRENRREPPCDASRSIRSRAESHSRPRSGSRTFRRDGTGSRSVSSKEMTSRQQTKRGLRSGSRDVPRRSPAHVVKRRVGDILDHLNYGRPAPNGLVEAQTGMEPSSSKIDSDEPTVSRQLNEVGSPHSRTSREHNLDARLEVEVALPKSLMSEKQKARRGHLPNVYERNQKYLEVRRANPRLRMSAAHKRLNRIRTRKNHDLSSVRPAYGSLLSLSRTTSPVPNDRRHQIDSTVPLYKDGDDSVDDEELVFFDEGIEVDELSESILDTPADPIKRPIGDRDSHRDAPNSILETPSTQMSYSFQSHGSAAKKSDSSFKQGIPECVVTPSGGSNVIRRDPTQVAGTAAVSRCPPRIPPALMAQHGSQEVATIEDDQEVESIQDSSAQHGLWHSIGSLYNLVFTPIPDDSSVRDPNSTDAEELFSDHLEAPVSTDNIVQGVVLPSRDTETETDVEPRTSVRDLLLAQFKTTRSDKYTSILTAFKRTNSRAREDYDVMKSGSGRVDAAPPVLRSCTYDGVVTVPPINDNLIDDDEEILERDQDTLTSQTLSIEVYDKGGAIPLKLAPKNVETVQRKRQAKGLIGLLRRLRKNDKHHEEQDEETSMEEPRQFARVLASSRSFAAGDGRLAGLGQLSTLDRRRVTRTHLKSPILFKSNTYDGVLSPVSDAIERDQSACLSSIIEEEPTQHQERSQMFSFAGRGGFSPGGLEKTCAPEGGSVLPVTLSRNSLQAAGGCFTCCGGGGPLELDQDSADEHSRVPITEIQVAMSGSLVSGPSKEGSIEVQRPAFGACGGFAEDLLYESPSSLSSHGSTIASDDLPEEQRSFYSESAYSRGDQWTQYTTESSYFDGKSYVDEKVSESWSDEDSDEDSATRAILRVAEKLGIPREEIFERTQNGEGIEDILIARIDTKRSGTTTLLGNLFSW